MNKKQKNVMWIGIALIVVMGIFPPWAISDQGSFAMLGYGFILSPPKNACHINTSHLYVQWIMVTVVTGGLVVTFMDKKKD
jgi:hypothetical protein